MASRAPSTLTRLRSRLARLPYSDPVEYRQALLIQTFLLAIIFLSFTGSFVTLLAPIARGEALLVMVIIWLNMPMALAGLWLLRRDQFTNAILLTCLGLIFLLGFLLILTGVQRSGALLFGFALPIMLAGLLASRRVLALTITLSSASILLTLLLEHFQVSLIGMATSEGENFGGVLGGFVVIALVLGIFVLRFGQALRSALHEAQERTQKLEQLQATLERRVAERTAELQAALAEVQLRAEQQARLFNENTQQRLMIAELGVPVLPVSARTMVVPLVGVLDSRRLLMLQERVLHALERSQARRVLLDVSAIPLIDSEVARGLLDVVHEARLLGAEAVLIGIRPEVAQALVSIGFEHAMVRTYRDLEAALHDEH